MSRIARAFKKDKTAFIAFVTGGDPDLETTEALIPEMAEAGADLIEIGIPFSDPIAEGAVIQAADERALRAGTTTDRLFEMVRRVRSKVDIPLVFMTYANPVFTYGTERFAQMCAECGIDGIIVPDVPYEEKEEVSGACRAAGIELISMIAPAPKERIRTIASKAQGFLYCASLPGAPRKAAPSPYAADRIAADIQGMIDQVRAVSDIPCAVSADIDTPQQVQKIARAADGAIAGTTVVSLIAQHGRECIRPVCHYIKEMKKAVAPL